MSDIKSAMDKAASSLDPAVRAMAIRAKMIEQEKALIDSFFEIYTKIGTLPGNGHAVVKTSEPKAKAPVATMADNGVRKRRGRGRGDKEDTFSPAIREIILEFGQPLKLGHLHEQYEQRYPNDSTAPETFRQRLIKRRHTIHLIPRQGYWLTDVEVPELIDEQSDLSGEPNGYAVPQ